MKVLFENLGTVNKNCVTIGSVTLFFSYETCICFRSNNDEGVRVNSWGPTTAKLLNELEPDKKARLPGDEFQKRLDKALATIGKE